MLHKTKRFALSCQISYTHIKLCLILQDSGISKEVIPPGNHNTLTADAESDELASEASKASMDEEVSPFTKRQKIDEPKEECLVMQEATESSILDWLRNYDDGVSEMEDPKNLYSFDLIPLKK